ncbi:MAG: T9SS type A sorting domain-containing protein [Chlorobi bacterium]|nr:T9SS type A sorting domain-containing protein [Chlorobiota bacterium]
MKYFTNKSFLVLLAVFFAASAYAQKKPIVKDDPIEREIYEIKRLADPATGKIPDNIREKELEFASKIASSSLKSVNAIEWQHRGPFNVGGRTRALAVDINNPNIILAGGVSGGMWRSTDTGSSWTKVTAPEDLHSVTAIAQDPRDGNTNIWYYVTGELSGNSASETGAAYRGNGVYKSTDNGLTWSALESTVTDDPTTFNKIFQYSWNVKVSPSNGYVFVATYGAIYRSTDGGTNWSYVLLSYNGNNYSYYTDIEVSPSGVLYAALSSDGDKHGFFKSTDNGDNWTEITPADFPADYGRTVIAVAPSNENTVYFLTHVDGSDAAGHNLWKYDAGSDSWSDLSSEIPDEDGITGSFDSQGGYDLLIKIKPDDEKFVIIGGTDLWRSTSGFIGGITSSDPEKIGGYKATNDSYASYTNHHPDQHSLVFFPDDPNKVISGHDGGLSLTTDITKSTEESDNETVVWSSLNAGYLTTQAYTVAIDHENDNDSTIISGFQDNGTWITQTTNGQANWKSLLGGDGSYCAIGENGNSFYTSSQNGTTYRDWEENGSSKWAEVDPDGAENQSFINPFVLDPNNTNMMYYLGGDVIWRNSDLTAIADYNSSPTSTNWTEMTNTTVTGANITALDVSKNPANILFFGTDNGKMYKVDNANDGDPAKLDISDDNFPNANIGCVTVNPNDGNEVLISFTNYGVISIWHTADEGLSWESVSGNLEENADGTGSGPSVRWVEILQKRSGDKIYFAGTSTGLYSTESLDGNNTVWTQESPDMIGNILVDMVDVNDYGTVAVGTHGNGIYSAQIDVSNAILKHRTDEIKAILYPNPSTGIFRVKAESNTPAEFRIFIFNMKGQAIYSGKWDSVTILDKEINLSTFPKGIYNVEVVRNGIASSYKLLLK